MRKVHLALDRGMHEEGTPRVGPGDAYRIGPGESAREKAGDVVLPDPGPVGMVAKGKGRGPGHRAPRAYPRLISTPRSYLMHIPLYLVPLDAVRENDENIGQW